MEDNIDLRWRKSSYSGNGGGNCVEVADQAARVLVRDTRDRTGPMLGFTPAAWRRFAAQLKRSLAARPYTGFVDTLGGTLVSESAPEPISVRQGAPRPAGSGPFLVT